MIEVYIPEHEIERVISECSGRTFNQRTIKPDSHEREVAHRVGELAAKTYFDRELGEGRMVHVGDCICDYDFEGPFTVDVKTCDRKVNPNPNYSGYVEKESFDQFSPDIYLLASYNKIGRVAHLMGWLSKHGYTKRCRLAKAGEVDDGKITDSDCYKVYYHEMWPVDELLPFLL